MAEPTPKYFLQVHPANQNIARVKGLSIKQLPPHEGGSWYMPLADAELFIRAQMMDELVGALRRARIYVNSRANYGHYDLEAREDLSRIDAILAKIDGTKP